MELQKPRYYNYCYVNGCRNSTLNYNKAFFKMPTNLQRRNQWLKLMKREDLIGSTCLRVRICEAHFTPNFIKHHQIRTLLIATAYPQLLLPIPTESEKETQTELGEITLCVCDLQTNYQVQTLIKTSNYVVMSYTKLTDPLGVQSSSYTGESNANNRASACRSTKLIPLLKHAEDIIVSVYNYLQAEYEQLKSSIGTSCDLSPLANILERTAAATGVSEHAVSAILEEKKRAADEELEASAAKRAKLTHDYGDGNVSPITDDESSREAPDEEQDHVTEQDDNNEQTHDNSQEPDEFEVETLKVEIKDENDQEPEEFEVETLKVEINDEDDDEPTDPLHMSETENAVQHLILSSDSDRANISITANNTDSVDVRKPPAVVVHPQCGSGLLRVKSIEPMTSIATVAEPKDDSPHRLVSTSKKYKGRYGSTKQVHGTKKRKRSVACTSDIMYETTTCDVK